MRDDFEHLVSEEFKRGSNVLAPSLGVHVIDSEHRPVTHLEILAVALAVQFVGFQFHKIPFAILPLALDSEAKRLPRYRFDLHSFQTFPAAAYSRSM